MLRKRKQKGFTLIELLIVIAIIGILAAIAVPIYRTQTVKAKLTEVTNAVSSVATAAKVYYEENGGFNWTSGNISTQIGFQNTLGVSVTLPSKYVSAGQIDQTTGIIRFTVQGTGESTVDGQTLILTPDLTGGGINWRWSGLPDPYLPKK